jgi:predicted ATPase/class 3 adenylate cyclase
MAGTDGELKQVTILFADIKSSLEIIENFDAEQAYAALDPAIQVMVAAVQRCGGTVNRIMGDGIMALFGAPCAQEDHAVRACRAALAILADVSQLGKAMDECRNLQVRIGISSGEVAVRSIRGEIAMPYDVFGVTAHVANRVEQLAHPGTAWLTETTARIVKGYVDISSLGFVPVKGLAKKIEVFQLNGMTSLKSPFEVFVARGLSRFVGRSREMEELHRVLKQAAGGSGRLVVLKGEPGVGKTRLCYEFSRSSRLGGCLILKAAATSYGAAIPWLQLANLLREFFEIGDDHPDQVRAKVITKLHDLEIELLPHLVPLLACLEAVSDDQEWGGLEPKARRARIHDALVAVLKRLGERQTTVLILEDLHDTDQETIDFLTALAGQLTGARLMALVTHRPQPRFEALAAGPAKEIELEPLQTGEVRELLDDLMGGGTALDPLKRQLAEMTDGNPFFLEETVRELVDSGVLAGSTGSYELTKTVPKSLLPPTIQATLAARIDRLSFEDKWTLRVAALIGDVVNLPLLRTIVAIDDVQLHRSLQLLCDLELLYDMRPPTGPSYRFRHALTRDVAYHGLPHWQQRVLHQRVVEAIEAETGAKPPETVAVLAEHALAGELWSKAFSHWFDLAERAMSRSASRDALAACEKADSALGKLGDSEDTIRQRIDLRFAQIEALFASGDHLSASDRVEEASVLAEQIRDRPRLVRALSVKAFRCWLNGEMENAVAAGTQARSIAIDARALDLQINTAYRLGAYLLGRGDYGAAVEPFEWAISAIPEARLNERFGLMTIAAAAARSALARTLAELLEIEAGRELARQAMNVAERFDHPFTLLYVTQEVGILYMRAGDIEEAIRVLSIGHRIARDLPTNVLRPAATSELGAALVDGGRVAEGIELLEEAVACARSLRLKAQVGQQLAYLARGYLLAGDAGKAEGIAREALDSAVSCGERGDEVWIRYLLAEIEGQRDPARMKMLVTDVQRLAGQRGMTTLEKVCREKLFATSGDMPRSMLGTRRPGRLPPPSIKVLH